MKILTTFCLMCISSFLMAQNCAQPIHLETLEGANVEMTVGIRDLWWNGSDARYFFPKRETDKVASLFAGAFWISGIGPNGELLVAAQQFGSNSGRSDYWAGPDGTAESCENWDQHFKIRKNEIDAFKNLTTPSINNIPESILKWPANGNPFFEEFNGFSLPLQTNGYADFIDQNGDGIYNPMDGDHPRLNGAVEIVWWVMNDFGNVHTESGGDPLEFQIQVTAYVFDQGQTTIDNSSIYKAKLINMAEERRRDCTFSLWVDADIGCSEDDLGGCLPDENLAFFYNVDEVDGSNGDNCTGGVNTHGVNPPVMGIKFMEPVSTNSDSLEMISFAMFNRNSEFPLEAGSPFAYVGNPADPNSVVQCDSLPSNDIRAVITFGHFNLEPNESQEFTFMVTGVEDIALPCPDITPLIEATNEVEEFFERRLVLTATRDAFLDSKALKVFPNPVSTKEELSISLVEEQVNIQEVRIFNQVGNLVYSYADINASVKVLSTANMSTGLYMLECIDDNGSRYIQKVVVAE